MIDMNDWDLRSKQPEEPDTPPVPVEDSEDHPPAGVELGKLDHDK